MELNDEVIKEGVYIIVQRQSYYKIHQFTKKQNIVKLGKDKVDVSELLSKHFWINYKMVPKDGSKRLFLLEETEKIKQLSDEIMNSNLGSGIDNRNIMDDGKSQLLTKSDIIELRDKGESSENILTKIVENSTTFKSKTEFAQKKYLKKKEKKYCQYITVRKPNLRLIANILFNTDQYKILGLRYDTLSQLISTANILPNSKFLLYENGTQGLVGSAILNYLTEQGILVNLYTGGNPQQFAINAMNYDKNKLNRLLNVRICDLMERLKSDEMSTSCKDNTNVEEKLKDEDLTIYPENNKRKLELNNMCQLRNKRFRWEENLEKVLKIIQDSKFDGLIIACKEYPMIIIENFIQFINFSRPLIVYSLYREPLVQIYNELKKDKRVIGLHLTETWLRNYQVLQDSSHPDVTMSGSGGYLLSGTIVGI